MQSIFENHLLASLPLEVQNRLRPHLEWVSLPIGKVLYESGEHLRQVYFPTCSIVSLIYVLDSGASAEIAMVGNEGLIGICVLLGGASSNHRAILQSNGYVYRISRQRLVEELQIHSEAWPIFMRYTQSLLAQMAQTAVCNRHHNIEQQLCRWLLTAIDRLPSHELNMTQELIANMLGVRREGVTEAAGKLQKIGAIEYSRGHINVLNRALLEKWSCECYLDLKKESNRLLPLSKNNNVSNNVDTTDATPGAHCCESASATNSLNKFNYSTNKHLPEVKNSHFV